MSINTTKYRALNAHVLVCHKILIVMRGCDSLFSHDIIQSPLLLYVESPERNEWEIRGVK